MTDEYTGPLTMEQQRRVAALETANQVMRSSGIFQSTQPKDADALIDLAEWIIDGDDDGDESEAAPDSMRSVLESFVREMTGETGKVQRISDGLYVSEIKIPKPVDYERQIVDAVKADAKKFAEDPKTPIEALRSAADEMSTPDGSCGDQNCPSCRARVEIAGMFGAEVKRREDQVADGSLEDAAAEEEPYNPADRNTPFAGEATHEDPVDFSNPNTGMTEPSDFVGGESDNRTAPLPVGKWEDAGTTEDGFR